jgi:hypothetical protein
VWQRAEKGQHEHDRTEVLIVDRTVPQHEAAVQRRHAKKEHEVWYSCSGSNGHGGPHSMSMASRARDDVDKVVIV